MKKSVEQRKKARLLKHYSIDEILEIMGYFEGVGSTAWDEATQLRLEALNDKTGVNDEFIDIVLSEAIINGNFEEVLKHNVRLPI